MRAQNQSIAIVTKLPADLNDSLEERYVLLPQGAETEMGLTERIQEWPIMRRFRRGADFLR
jgi:hypothetical protein